MVLQVGKSFQQIRDEITRWRDILTIPYQEYLLGKQDAGLTLET